jgi:hypothetical protein
MWCISEHLAGLQHPGNRHPVSLAMIALRFLTNIHHDKLRSGQLSETDSAAFTNAVSLLETHHCISTTRRHSPISNSKPKHDGFKRK